MFILFLSADRMYQEVFQLEHVLTCVPTDEQAENIAKCEALYRPA